VIDLRALQAELARSSNQTSENIQTANAFSGAQVTNTSTQAETQAQTGSTLLTRDITIDPAVPPVGGIPQKFLSNFNFIAKLATLAKSMDFLARGQGDNLQIQRVGQTAFAQGADPGGVNSTAANTLTQDSDSTQTLTQTGITTNFTAQTGTLPIVVAREREIIVESNRINTGGVLNSSQLQGTAPSSTPGAKEVLRSVRPLLTAGNVPATLATNLNDLLGGSGTLQPGVDTITIDGFDKNGIAIPQVVFTFGTGAPGTAEVLTSELPALIATGNVTPSAATRINDLASVGTAFKVGDKLRVFGTDGNGAAFNVEFVFSTGVAGGVADDTLGDLLTFINGNGGAIPDKIAGATLSLSNGRLLLTADAVGAKNLALTLSDPTTPNLGGGKLAGGAHGSDIAFAETTPGVNAVNGDGVTVGDLINKISAAFADATANLDNTGRIVLIADDVGEANFGLILADAGGPATRDFTNNGFVEATPGANPVIDSSILTGASFQIARANGADASNILDETATNTQTNTVNNTHTVDVRQIAGGQTAALTPRSMDIIVRMNTAKGDISRVSNVATAVQKQALKQISEGGVDQSGAPTDQGGNASNQAQQSAQSSDTTTVSESTTIQA
jgi:hypothetical protein